MSSLSGHIDAGLADRFVDWFTAALAEQPDRLTTVVHDWAGIVSYEPAVRHRVVSFAHQNRKRFTTIYIFTESKMLRMGIAVAKLVLGDLVQTLATRAELDALVARAAS